MKNNGENLKLIMFLLLLSTTLLWCIALQHHSRWLAKEDIACKSEIISIVEDSISRNTDKIISEMKADNTKVEEESKEVSDTETPKSDIPIIKEPFSEVINQTDNTRFEIGESVPLPSLPTHVKLCTDYRCYNLWYTPHYRMQQSAYTDNDGLRRFNQDYVVALGAFYSTDIGDRFKVTLENGNEFTIILGDGKDPADCDPDNMYAPCVDYDGTSCANVLEFIIDSDVMSPNVYSYGSIDCIEGFGGNIVKMEYLGRDQSADWTTYETK